MAPRVRTQGACISTGGIALPPGFRGIGTLLRKRKLSFIKLRPEWVFPVKQRFLFLREAVRIVRPEIEDLFPVKAEQERVFLAFQPDPPDPVVRIAPVKTVFQRVNHLLLIQSLPRFREKPVN